MWGRMGSVCACVCSYVQCCVIRGGMWACACVRVCVRVCVFLSLLSFCSLALSLSTPPSLQDIYLALSCSRALVLSSCNIVFLSSLLVVSFSSPTFRLYRRVQWTSLVAPHTTTSGRVGLPPDHSQCSASSLLTSWGLKLSREVGWTLTTAQLLPTWATSTRLQIQRLRTCLLQLRRLNLT